MRMHHCLVLYWLIYQEHFILRLLAAVQSVKYVKFCSISKILKLKIVKFEMRFKFFLLSICISCLRADIVRNATTEREFDFDNAQILVELLFKVTIGVLLVILAIFGILWCIKYVCIYATRPEEAAAGSSPLDRSNADVNIPDNSTTEWEWRWDYEYEHTNAWDPVRNELVTKLELVYGYRYRPKTG